MLSRLVGVVARCSSVARSSSSTLGRVTGATLASLALPSTPSTTSSTSPSTTSPTSPIPPDLAHLGDPSLLSYTFLLSQSGVATVEAASTSLTHTVVALQATAASYRSSLRRLAALLDLGDGLPMALSSTEVLDLVVEVRAQVARERRQLADLVMVFGCARRVMESAGEAAWAVGADYAALQAGSRLAAAEAAVGGEVEECRVEEQHLHSAERSHIERAGAHASTSPPPPPTPPLPSPPASPPPPPEAIKVSSYAREETEVVRSEVEEAERCKEEEEVEVDTKEQEEREKEGFSSEQEEKELLREEVGGVEEEEVQCVPLR